MRDEKQKKAQGTGRPFGNDAKLTTSTRHAT